MGCRLPAQHRVDPRQQFTNCRKIGMASLSLNDDAPTVTVLSVPDGFEIVQREYGPNFQCETCNVAAEP